MVSSPCLSEVTTTIVRSLSSKLSHDSQVHPSQPSLQSEDKGVSNIEHRLYLFIQHRGPLHRMTMDFKGLMPWTC
jgi:hypothetical protein